MKKKLKLILSFIIIYIISIPKVFALDYQNICNNNDFLSAIRIFSVLVSISKIVIPLLIIILGMIDFGKAVVSKDDKGINKSTKVFIRRIIAGISIYFIPTIILSLFSTLEISDIYQSKNFKKCTDCLLDTNKCELNNNGMIANND